MELCDFEKEYYDEINRAKVSIERLKKLGVTDKTLAKEVYLHQIYGEKIIEDVVDDTLAKGAKRSVTRLMESELSIKSELTKIYEDIDRSIFDEKLDTLGIKFE